MRLVSILRCVKNRASRDVSRSFAPRKSKQPAVPVNFFILRFALGLFVARYQNTRRALPNMTQVNSKYSRSMSSTSQRIPTTIASRSFSRNYSLAKIVTRQRAKWIRNEEPGPVLVSSGMYLDRRAILGRVSWRPSSKARRNYESPEKRGRVSGARRGCFDGCGSRMRSAGLAFSRREANLGRAPLARRTGLVFSACLAANGTTERTQP